MISIPVSGTIFIVVMIVGGLLWALELAQKASRASRRASADRVRRRPPVPPGTEPSPYQKDSSIRDQPDADDSDQR